MLGGEGPAIRLGKEIDPTVEWNGRLRLMLSLSRHATNYPFALGYDLMRSPLLVDLQKVPMERFDVFVGMLSPVIDWPFRPT
jgi:hypothetical protein